MKQKQSANLRCCMSCEWIFSKAAAKSTDCPRCEWPSYSAHYVHGAKAYRYHRTQEPWFQRRISKHATYLNDIIAQANPVKVKAVQYVKQR